MRYMRIIKSINIIIEYEGVLSTAIRNEWINEHFGNISCEMMTFVPIIHEIDVSNITHLEFIDNSSINSHERIPLLQLRIPHT